MKVTFAAGIESVSGISRNKHGGGIVFKKCRGDKPGTGRAYLVPPGAYKRRKPVGKEEAKARVLFQVRAGYVKKLMEEDRTMTRQKAWAKAKRDITMKDLKTMVDPLNKSSLIIVH